MKKKINYNEGPSIKLLKSTDLETVTKVTFFGKFWAPIPPKKSMKCNKIDININFDVREEKCGIFFINQSFFL